MLGDQWTLLVIRDMVFRQKRHYREFLDSPEGIATNILADRLKNLEAAGIVARNPDPDHGRRVIYTLTDKGVDLIPLLLALIEWGAKYDPHTAAPPAFIERIQKDRKGLMEDLRRNLQPVSEPPKTHNKSSLRERRKQPLK